MATFSESLNFSVVTCAKCGVGFAVPTHYEKQRRSDHLGFWCPNGHSNVFSGKSEEEKLRDQLSQKQAQINRERENLIAAQRENEKAQKQIKTLKKRAAAGTCPCCNRTFEQLSRHMQSKHKAFVELQGMKIPKQLTGNIQ